MIRIISLFLLFASVQAVADRIDRRALVERNNPTVSTMDTLSSLTVGNGRFAYTVDATGMQSFPEYYSRGVCLGTMSEWGWHSFPNTSSLKPEEALKSFDFGHHIDNELYSCQTKTQGRAHDASEYFRINPHRLHLGTLGFDFPAGTRATDISNISQKLDMWNGVITSVFSLNGKRYMVETVADSELDAIAIRTSNPARTPLALRLPYPTGGHVDDACDWNATTKHCSRIVERGKDFILVRHDLDSTHYFVHIRWEGKASASVKPGHKFVITPKTDDFCLTCIFIDSKHIADYDFGHSTYRWDNALCPLPTAAAITERAAIGWQRFWEEGAAVDFSHCTDPRAKELERRVVLSQYLINVQEQSCLPPQETGLTMNSWYGKFHLEMVPWHLAWMPLWGHPKPLEKALSFYGKQSTLAVAKGIARRQGFDGVRWMKMTDPEATEAPSNVGSFLIWQQPHPIYLWELVARHYMNGCHKGDCSEKFNATSTDAGVMKIIDNTARFMCSFANYDSENDRYVLKHYIPAQESLKADVTFNSPFELSQWHCTLQMAQLWRERNGLERNKEWDRIVEKLSPLAYNSDSLYLSAESAIDTYTNLKATSDHPALLGALGFFPMSRLIDRKIMDKTLDWVMNNWNWPTSWGWDFPMTAMTATRLLQPEKAIEALMMPMQKNTYLNNGHNYQDQRLRLYLPGNGALLSAIALMCAGWDGCETRNPGFPADGSWDVRWEGLQPLP